MYITALSVEGEFICCECGDVVDEDYGAFSLEQIEKYFEFDTNSISLKYIENSKHELVYNDLIHTSKKLRFYDSFDEAVQALRKAIKRIVSDRELMVLILKNNFSETSALLKMLELV